MLLFNGGLALVAIAVWIFCIIDVITTPDGAARNLPKVVWLILVIILVDIGSLAWLVAGRPWNRSGERVSLRSTPTVRSSRTGMRAPDDDEEFLAQLRARAEEQRRRAREAQREEGDKPEST